MSFLRAFENNILHKICGAAVVWWWWCWGGGGGGVGETLNRVDFGDLKIANSSLIGS